METKISSLKYNFSENTEALNNNEIYQQFDQKLESGIFDPLSTNLITSTEKLISKINEIQTKNPLQPIINIQQQKILTEFISYFKNDNEEDNNKNGYLISSLFCCISELLLIPALTFHIANFFRPLLIDLVARWLLLPQNNYNSIHNKSAEIFDASFDPANDNSLMSRVECVAHSFGLLLPIAPQLKSLAVSFFTCSPSLFERFNFYESNIKSGTSTKYLQDLLITSFRLLNFSKDTFSQLWDWSPLYKLLSHSNLSIRYLTICCLSHVLNMSDSQRHQAFERWVEDSENNEKMLVEWENGRMLDLGMLTLIEQENIASAQLSLFNNEFNHQEDLQKDNKYRFFMESNLSSNIINLCGVLLPKFHHNNASSVNNSSKELQRLVMTKTTQRNINSIALAISIGAPVLLEGIIALLRIHIGDQTDSKILLGTYVSTSTPASFRWQPGVLTTAVREGRWILIEDIDLAPSEVISVLIPLLETRQLFIPSRGEVIKAKEGFQIFATKSLLPEKSNLYEKDSRSIKYSNSNSNNIMGYNLWTKMKIDNLDFEELVHIINIRFPNLQELSSSIIHVFKSITLLYEKFNSSGMRSSSAIRFISTRDLMKWCYRISILIGNRSELITSEGLDQKTREDLFSEAADCFCGMISDYEDWIKALEYVGEALLIPKERIHSYVNAYIPTLDISKYLITIGRANLKPFGNNNKKNQLLLSKSKKGKRTIFANTSHALRLLEKIAVCVYLCEPILLVGETGTGKTTVIQHLADLLQQNLVVVNLSQQSDSSDLLGGFKPVDAKVLATPLKEEFDVLFERTFSIKRNPKFLDMVRKMYVTRKFEKFATLLMQAVEMAEKRFNNEFDREENSNNKSSKSASPELRQRWKNLADSVNKFQYQHTQIRGKLMFNFVEGTLVKAVINGDWILLDEINLASTETLECLSGLLQDSQGSILLTEKGDTEVIKRHPNFRIFACMNPATDVGKRDLPPALRNRFTEFYVHPPDTNQEDLLAFVKQYLMGCLHGDEHAPMDIIEFYLTAKNLLTEHKLADGANQRPHFSMRTLARALIYVKQIMPIYGFRRSIYEGFCMTFLTQLNQESEIIMRGLIEKFLLRGVKNPHELISRIPREPPNDLNGKYIQFGYFWLERGSYPIEEMPHYILTKSVKEKLNSLARVISSKKFPVLIQGPTSAGKTSMIEYLAKRTGHRFVRINNHEHTDLQEYLGTYVSNSEGKLEFQEGVLVEALKNGYWIVLDELNLAPSDVLEALNRLLDDNRELMIPETQQIIEPHKDFMLFATQNPPGLYGGRKVLSRAFRNRFLELHFDDIPDEELETILSERCRIAPSYGKKLVQVYKQLMEKRQGTRIFEQKHGYITLRDLFRWAERGAVGYQELAEHGYMLLAERIRKPDEKLLVKNVLETVMKVKINEELLYDCTNLNEYQQYLNSIRQLGKNDIVWTKSMKRLFTLVSHCLRFNEPVLLIGETGCGKTTVCQMIAQAKNKAIHIVNCHQNTETSDLLGGQRPVRNKANSNAELKNDLIAFLRTHLLSEENSTNDTELDQLIFLFENGIKGNKVMQHNHNETISSLQTRCQQARALFQWYDGALIKAMRKGEFFLLDEISLADDSVVERLNSVLESNRLLVLPEKGGLYVEELNAHDEFQFLATMNPGGDYGKKELSPALRNRFTEIWVPPVTDREDLLKIITTQFNNSSLLRYGERILTFIEWYYSQSVVKTREILSLRDILTWVSFMNITTLNEKFKPSVAFKQGGCLVLLDRIGSDLAVSDVLYKEFRDKCIKKLSQLVEDDGEIVDNFENQIISTSTHFGINPFYIERGSLSSDYDTVKFQLQAPTTFDNVFRVLRAMLLKKPILLEGSPGVGKTSLISALAASSGHRLIRINLSEQTDLMDLFGSDLPVEGGHGGEFAWRDAPFLQAMRAGDWVLLDELNLASQSVLEGLNSCLDHRGSVYIPELDREFSCANEFRVFGAQNPFQQGGGRKGLPKSFVNRFIKVYLEQLTKEDMIYISQSLFSEIDLSALSRMIEFNTRIYESTMISCEFAHRGSPWEFNLRDVIRWLELMRKDSGLDFKAKPSNYLDLLYLQRMRTAEDRDHVISLYNQIFDLEKYEQPKQPSFHIDINYLQIGNSILPRKISRMNSKSLEHQLHLLQSDLRPLQAIMKCVEMNWMVILNGPEASGKTSMIRLLAQLTDNQLEEYAMNSGVDTIELLGGFEQLDLARHRRSFLEELNELSYKLIKSLLLLRESVSSPFSMTMDGQKQQVLHTIGQLNDLLFTLENQYKLSSDQRQTIDFGIIDRILEIVGQSIANFELFEFNSYYSKVSQRIMTLKQLENESVSGRFEWIDGVLINALENGHWLLIDNANLCNPSVLDRLNPVIEPNGFLLLNERGQVDDNGNLKIIRPHKNFRLFMTVDPRNGELSRAMRNRGVEVSLLNADWSKNPRDLIKLTNGIGFRGEKLPLLVGAIHKEMESISKNLSPRNYLKFVQIMLERLQRGDGLKPALQNTLKQIYDSLEYEKDYVHLEKFDIDQVLSKEATLINSLSSTNCPLFIGGNIFREESTIGRILLHGAYLYCLVQKHHLGINDNFDSNMIGHFASQHLLENISTKDYNMCTRLLNYLSSNMKSNIVPECGFIKMHHFLLENLFQHPVAAQIAEHKRQLAKIVNLDERFIANQPLDITNNPDLVKVFVNGMENNERIRTLWNMYLIKIKELELLTRVKRDEYIENINYQHAARQNTSRLSIVQQSYMYQIEKQQQQLPVNYNSNEKKLEHPVMVAIYPFFEGSRRLIGDLLENGGFYNTEMFLFIHKFLDYHEFFWRQCTSTTKLNLGNIKNCLDFMYQLSKDLLQTFGGDGEKSVLPLLDLVDTLRKEVNVNTGISTNLLWKRFHPVMMSKMEFYDLEQELRGVGVDLFDFYDENKQDDPKLMMSNMAGVFLDSKKMLIDAIVTLYFIDENYHSVPESRKLFVSIQKTPSHIRNQIEKQLKASSSLINVIKTHEQQQQLLKQKQHLYSIFDFMSVVKEMHILAKLQFLGSFEDPKLDKDKLYPILEELNKLLEFSIQKSTRSPLDFVPHQRLLWIYGRDSNEILCGWQARLWQTSFNEYFSVENGDRSFSSSSSSIDFINNDVVAEMPCYINKCQIDLSCLIFQLVQILLTHREKFDAETFHNLSESLDNLTRSTVPTLFPKINSNNIIHHVNDDDKYINYMHSLLVEMSPVTLPSLQMTEKILKETNGVDSKFHEIINSYFIPAIQLIQQIIEEISPQIDEVTVNTDNNLNILMGKSWTLLSLGFIALYIPNYPVDPTSESRLTHEFLDNKRLNLETEIQVRENIQQYLTGESTNSIVDNRRKELENVAQELKLAEINMTLRPKQSDHVLIDLFKDIRYLCDNVIDVRHMDELLMNLEKPIYNNDLSIYQREALFQSKTFQFINRLSKNFPLFRDITHPLITSIYQLKYGVRVIAAHSSIFSNVHDGHDNNLHHNEKNNTNFVYSILMALLKISRTMSNSTKIFNHSIEKLCSQETMTRLKRLIFQNYSSPMNSEQYLQYLITVLKCVYYRVVSRGQFFVDKDLEIIDKLYSEIASVYSAAQDCQRKKTEETEKLYKQKAKTQSAIFRDDDDHSIIEYEVKKLFPDFNREYREFQESENADNDDEENSNSESLEYDDEEIMITRFNATIDNSDRMNLSKSIFWSTFRMARDIFTLSHRLFPENLDFEMQSTQMLGTFILKDWLSNGNQQDFQMVFDNYINNKNERVYDFYRDPNLNEAKKINPILSEFQTRIKNLLEEWPDHAVLLQLYEISIRIQSFVLNSPIAKFLTGLELLLQKSAEWEAYASSRVSLQIQLDQITSLIIAWRQLELNCWPNLLAAQDKYYAESVYQWWFHLYNCVVSPAIGRFECQVFAKEEITKHITQIVETLDQFLQSSKLGDFQARLDLIHSFYLHLCVNIEFQKALQKRDDQEAATTISSYYNQAADALYNVYKYYSQFLTQHGKSLEEMRKPIEKDLKDFVKLASWKDVNIYALKKSAEKTHRHLSKCIRKYKQVLDKPITEIIVTYQSSSSSDNTISIIKSPEFSSDQENWVSNLLPVDQPPPQIQELLSRLDSKRVSATPERFTNVNQTLEKLYSYCINDIFVKRPSCQGTLDKFATQIILRIKSLQEETPALMNDENQSSVKALKMIKKKALVDLLKELKRLGLNPFIKNKRVEQQQNLVGYLLQLPRLNFEKIMESKRWKSTITTTAIVHQEIQDSIESLRKADDYYYRIVARMTHLRYVANNPSHDLTSLEIQKGLSFTEDFLHLIILERLTLHQIEQKFSYIFGSESQFERIYTLYHATFNNNDESKLFISLNTIDEKAFCAHKEFLDDLVNLLSYTCLILNIQKELADSEDDVGLVDSQHQSRLSNWLDQIIKVREDILVIYNQVILNPSFTNGHKAFITEDIIIKIQNNMETINLLYDFVENLCHRIPQSRHFLLSIVSCISSYKSGNHHSNDAVLLDDENFDENSYLILDLCQKTNDLIDAVLLSVQNLLKMEKVKKATRQENQTLNKNNINDENSAQIIDEMPDQFIRSEHQTFVKTITQLNLNAFIDSCDAIHEKLSIIVDSHHINTKKNRHLLTFLIQRIFPFIKQYILLIQYYLSQFFIYHKSICKLAYVLINSFTTIFTKGFCMPAQEGEACEGAAQDGVQGTGIGEGEGSKDVSEEIEDEEQVLGTQDGIDNHEKSEKRKDEGEKGIEMEKDFEGELEDLDTQEMSEDGNDDDNESQELELDEQIGKLDDTDPDVVDEKMWGDNSAESADDSRKTIDHEQTNDQDGETEIVAKDNEDQDDVSKKQKDLQQETNRDVDLNLEEQEREFNESEQDDEYNNYERNEQSLIEVPEAETLELPEDLKMDEDDDILNEPEDDQIPDGNLDDSLGNMDIDEPEMKESEKNVQEEITSESALDDSAKIIQEDKDDREKPKDKLDLCSNNLEKSSTQKENRTLDFDVNNSVQNDADQQMDITSNECNQNTQINNKDNEDENKDDREKPKDKLDLYPNNLEKSSTQKDSRTLDFDANNSVENDADQQMDITSNECNQNTTQINNEGESKKPKAEEKIQDINPHRSLGDAMEQWRKRLNIIDIDNSVTENHESEHEEQQKETESYINHQKMFEYLKDDETSHDTQTMGPAAEDQTREMDITGAIDDDDEDMYQNSEDAVEDGMGGAILNKRKKDSGTHQSNDDHEEEEAVSQNMDMSNIVHAPIPQEQFASMRDHLEMKLSEWRENGRDVVQARDLWQKYDSLTHDLANGLCEQLRLILEPTMATRLKGDYKTGKRLNMKKIIPYIASDFKKDKIWLRRTKPSKRQYQVMIAVDDSKSMCETHSIQLAYETLALISKALSQLEVGAISIVNFGKDVRILHPFDQPFTADAGAKVLQQFTFEQDKTLVRSLMDTTIGLLKHARVNNIGTNGGASRNTELWQLQIIISDGVCEDHASLKTLVRQAAEAQIMVIFIIVDNKPNEKDSIMSMNHVKYSQVDGRMMLRMQKYLDTFPFDYYVVLRDINALPETLADALRQYFSVVGNL
ncbi:6305_t:CDS:10 [Ambispora leptoticha]|uniref:Midasin n=1 Tax=Ambispora leptoticha TaxID=144679 RepID=A0A9N8W2P4_9GLOM|nr:6305_t:CDS:10 [Ambispora leptoticha]